MSATNKTTHYELPVFVGGDMPAWLTDFNGAMTAIDAGIYQAKTAGDGAQSSADTANANLATLSDTVTGVAGRVTTLEGTVSSQGGNIDTINSLIGNGEPTTTDKTIIGAINELAAEIPTPGPVVVDADDVTYDNTSSGLTATNVQTAIDELETEIQAIQPGSSYDLDLSTNVTATVTAESGFTVNNSEVHVLTNAAANIGKVYGGLDVSIPAGTYTADVDIKVATISASNLPTIQTVYDIFYGYLNMFNASWLASNPTKLKLHFNTNGTIDVVLTPVANFTEAHRTAISLPPCLLFLKDLGD